MRLSPRLLLPPLFLTWVCVSVLAHDFERDAQTVLRVAPGMDQRARASAHGTTAPLLPGMLRVVNLPFESWAPAGSGVTASFSMRLITLGRRN